MTSSRLCGVMSGVPYVKQERLVCMNAAANSGMPALCALVRAPDDLPICCWFCVSDVAECAVHAAAGLSKVLSPYLDCMV